MSKLPDPRIQTPEAMKVQLARLFGSDSSEANKESRTLAEWRKTFRHCMKEIELYIEHSVDSDSAHRLLLQTAVWSAQEALKRDGPDLYIAYIEALTRMALALMGDYPDHRRRKGSGIREGHYSLKKCRTIHYSSTPMQRLWVLKTGYALKIPGCSIDPLNALQEFRSQFGSKPNMADFIRWFARTYPVQYAACV